VLLDLPINGARDVTVYPNPFFLRKKESAVINQENMVKAQMEHGRRALQRWQTMAISCS